MEKRQCLCHGLLPLLNQAPAEEKTARIAGNDPFAAGYDGGLPLMRLCHMRRFVHNSNDLSAVNIVP